ncbi:hypothetical protein [Nocardia gipuzkoensis]|uniref:hypothetical protein n=1 Tax=Nocardia gipuzkoensis TaxID=2749991 RepID=UPI001C66C346|nr:hypothetical protein [Nocardia gipuzkoensis]
MGLDAVEEEGEAGPVRCIENRVSGYSTKLARSGTSVDAAGIWAPSPTSAHSSSCSGLPPLTATKDGDPKGIVRSGFFGTDKLGFAGTRAEIAAFTADQVGDTGYLRRAPAISY